MISSSTSSTREQQWWGSSGNPLREDPGPSRGCNFTRDRFLSCNCSCIYFFCVCLRWGSIHGQILISWQSEVGFQLQYLTAFYLDNMKIEHEENSARWVGGRTFLSPPRQSKHQEPTVGRCLLMYEEEGRWSIPLRVQVLPCDVYEQQRETMSGSMLRRKHVLGFYPPWFGADVWRGDVARGRELAHDKLGEDWPNNSNNNKRKAWSH